MSRTEEETKKLLELANSLPMRPGVYIMRGASDSVIYVGKAKKLKNRVTKGQKRQKRGCSLSF